MAELLGIDWAVAAVMLPLLGAMLAFAVPRAAAGGCRQAAATSTKHAPTAQSFSASTRRSGAVRVSARNSPMPNTASPARPKITSGVMA